MAGGEDVPGAGSSGSVPRAECRWTNTSARDGNPVASGTVTADKYALATLKQITVGKAGNRIRIEVGR
ncbi:MAG TPA: hypothetical protein VFJ30_08670 [Phycisphaerae bacterium]|nr:hypothetical protein [Phycisphaerae bacterium]